MAQPVRVQHVRKRNYSRIRHASSNLLAFLTGQAARLGATVSNHACTVDESVGEFTITTGVTGFTTGRSGPIVFLDTDDADLPEGLEGGTRYWPVVLDESTFMIATSRENAANGVYITGFGDPGNVGLAYQHAAAKQDMFSWLRKGTKARTIRGTADIDTNTP